MDSSESWLLFYGVAGVSVIGGYLDSRGSSRTALLVQRDCLQSLTIYGSKDELIQNFISTNAKLYHIVVHTCTNVTLQGVRIYAPENSPNTDGVHVQNSIDVGVLNTIIKTGDDCILIGPGTKNLQILRVACGPGHGIRKYCGCFETATSFDKLHYGNWNASLVSAYFLSVNTGSTGSLGKEFEDGVENVTVKIAVFKGTQNGLRIKSWGRPSNGFARGIVFKQVLMNNVQNPVVIDQNYRPRSSGCPSQNSDIKISHVMYTDIKGTSASQVAMKFDCSATSPCNWIGL
ncbi:hypothetical protein NE237_025734 [Protea cynaroides]|uniref:Endo-polygalacturonase n=1 Tax=Protea cynaroides TaxID=273540 RepID=A0A9Q0K216_9MAGN|nr:hypothetical protein NE237_025734 [Protea cynaroides]